MSDFDIKYVDENSFDSLWEKICEIRSGGTGHKIFLEQIYYIKGIRWNGNIPAEKEFSKSYPTIPDMSKRQFKFYLYYRTKMLDSQFFMPNSISYIHTFVYEIVTATEDVEVDLIEDICEYLIGNLKKHFVGALYGSGGDYGLTSKIERLKPNIVLVYEYKKQGKKAANITEIRYGKCDLELWEGVADYRVRESEFLNKYFLLEHVKQVLKKIVIELKRRFASSELDIIRYLVGDTVKKVDYSKSIENLLWSNYEKQKFLPIELAKIQYNPSDYEEICIVDDYGNTIKKVNMSIKEIWNNLALYILKSIEVDFMSYVGYRTRLRKPKVDLDKTGIKVKTYEGTVRFFSSDAKKRTMQYTFICEIPNIMETVNRVIEKFIDDNKLIFDEVAKSVEADGMCIKKKIKKEVHVKDNAPVVEERNVEKISYDTLQAAREVLYKNQERLVIEDDSFMQENQEEQHISVSEFTEKEIDLLRILLNHGDLVGYEKKIQETYCTINMIIEKINTKSTDLIGDVVIEEVLGTVQIIDDYIDVCEKWVKCYG